ncbi:hypothetical protein AVEN_270810-1 [Araneus ventricosus]|uniref:Uncharacterized protein n=1 Tax=Araneus ventricosus TaxID=182803 RepID=A0A4Y2U622_ARAVE|nr:hypothetical protein AVEN_253481-1 [Araneus ventricosus]GBO08072.1 hypothetical protein AVEN_270810-1 [Araneus ventricosus]
MAEEHQRNRRFEFYTQAKLLTYIIQKRGDRNALTDELLTTIGRAIGGSKRNTNVGQFPLKVLQEGNLHLSIGAKPDFYLI